MPPAKRCQKAKYTLNEPFAWSLTNNGRSAIGVDTDGYFQVANGA